MKTFAVILTNNPVDNYWNELIPERIGKEYFNQLNNWSLRYTKVSENDLAKTLYNLIDLGSSFRVLKLNDI